MTVFDPDAMIAPLTTGANALNFDSGAPAVLVEASRGGRTANATIGVDSLGSDVSARYGQTFEIGSQTKMMTAAVVVMLAEEGLLDLDAPIANYLPDATTAGIANAQTATVRQVLQMRSGIPSYVDAVDGSGNPLYVKRILDHPDQVFGPDQELAIARDLSPSEAPGAFHYGNTTYVMLGLMIEHLTGQSFGEVLEERIFDPVGMTHTSYGLGADPLRISSYRSDGGLTDVTDALWAPRGESGVTSTTTDLIAFLKALLVDETLLSPWALGQMTDWKPLFGRNDNTFGLGLFKQTVGGETVIGFSGGTLGTSSATWYHVGTGAIVSVTATVDGANSGGSTHEISAWLKDIDTWAPVADDGGPLEIRSVCAADLTVSHMEDGLCFSAHQAAVTLDLSLRGLAADATVFEDGSVLIVGDGTAGTTDDDLANIVKINVSYAAASHCNNQLIGLGGDDILAGGQGNDRINAGTGRDRAVGGAGDDRISGGSLGDTLIGGRGDDRIWAGGGWDTLYGRHGADVLVGGGGNDTFRFNDNDSLASDPDTIRDFELARDTIDLHLVNAVAGDRRSAFDWIGESDFSGTAGELRFEHAGSGLRVEGDTDGDGQADLAIVLNGLDSLSSHHFLL